MDNRETSANPARPAQDEDPTACAAQLRDCCRRNVFRPDLPSFQHLCRLATDPNREHAAPATTAIFHELIEPLCDDFTAAASTQAHAVLACLLAFIAATPSGQPMRELLKHLGLVSPEALLKRWRHLTSPAACPVPAILEKIEAVLIPSRISIGADVAITSVLAQRLAQALPGAEIVLVGPDHLGEIFPGLPRVRHLPFALARHGDLSERLLFWPQLLAATAPALAGRPAERLLVVDSDSRLTQLGLLPLAIGPAACQFPSHSLSPRADQGSISTLANQWLDGWLGEASPCYPAVTPAPDKEGDARAFCGRLRENGVQRLLLVNFGVGGEPRKSLGEGFEQQLLAELLRTEKTMIILDMGCGSEEKVRAEKQVGFLAAGGRETKLLQDWQLPLALPPFGHGVIGLCSSLGTLAALVGHVDCYLGYDSCGQHLANGAGTPAVTIFVGAPNPRFLERWSPLNPAGTNRVIPVADRNPSPAETAATISRILQTVNQLSTPR